MDSTLNNSQLSYFARLDFLRFLAVSLVIIQHWFKTPINQFELGSIGVIIFFVLSGFLITRILLNSKQKIKNKNLSLQRALYVFYMRRTLRIFPIYYLLIFFLFLFNHPIVKENFWWFFFYASNIKTYIDQEWLRTLGPLWSLAVEEQFYLVWPTLILLINPKNIGKLLSTFVVLGPIFRLLSILIAEATFGNVNYHISGIVLMPCNIDAFAIGGLLALKLFDSNYANSLQLLKSPLKWLFFIPFIGIYFLKDNLVFEVLFTSIISGISLIIIDLLIAPQKMKFWDKLTLFQPFVYLGKISYGLYLYHGPFFYIMAIFFAVFNKVIKSNLSIITINPFEGNWASFLNVMFLIFISSISWYIIEKPINKLKKHFRI
ncbi:acyltransferase family protein [Saccharicrinis sp. 156]|uniref:acyltransferase family protein n=1 Tax=Saccharicrinis sp. 156 TaxID=3417574 RepID=UPI003D34435A